MPFTGTVILRVGSSRSWELVNPVVYTGQRESFSIPAGFITDLASVPQPVQWLTPRYGKYTAAAILHDYLVRRQVVPSRDADGLFRRVLREQGVSTVHRWLMWAGVRWGALFNAKRRPGWLADAPLVIGITVLAAPFVVPPTLAAAVALFFLGTD
jgi:hypothetical protein